MKTFNLKMILSLATSLVLGASISTSAQADSEALYLLTHDEAGEANWLPYTFESPTNLYKNQLLDKPSGEGQQWWHTVTYVPVAVGQDPIGRDYSNLHIYPCGEGTTLNEDGTQCVVTTPIESGSEDEAIEQLVNLALASNGATATQSTTSHDAPASRAIDGDTNGLWAGNSVTHTNGENAWWELKLPSESSIESIRLYNRTDFMPRLTDVTVQVLDASRNVVKESDVLDASDKEFIDIPDMSSTGQFVRVSIPGAYLHLAEVEVLGHGNSPESLEGFVAGSATSTECPTTGSPGDTGPMQAPELNCYNEGSLYQIYFDQAEELEQASYETNSSKCGADGKDWPAGSEEAVANHLRMCQEIVYGIRSMADAMKQKATKAGQDCYDDYLERVNNMF